MVRDDPRTAAPEEFVERARSDRRRFLVELEVEIREAHVSRFDSETRRDLVVSSAQGESADDDRRCDPHRGAP